MQVEECCQALFAEILPAADPSRTGVAIDVGVGTFAFYCELFNQIGFRSVAVEPMPNDNLREICRRGNIALIESCVSEIDGTADLFIGTFDGIENLNLNSMRPDWWGVTKHKRVVKSMRLTTLLETINARRVTCLKLDVEGMEKSIIEQLRVLSSEMLPRVIMFEYGGGGTRESGEAGWSENSFASTIRSLEILRELGYGQSILIESALSSIEVIFDLQSVAFQPASIFTNDCTYGNIICIRELTHPREKITNACASFRGALPQVSEETELSP